MTLSRRKVTRILRRIPNGVAQCERQRAAFVPTLCVHDTVVNRFCVSGTNLVIHGANW
jgi:hypothetical protein